jgi:hypothetical protein
MTVSKAKLNPSPPSLSNFFRQGAALQFLRYITAQLALKISLALRGRGYPMRLTFLPCEGILLVLTQILVLALL